ncbi:MAG: Type fimbrial biosis protein PilV [Rhodocyclales bacterium]|nr:Type fimbrial biosis protein PilV [Rhodocyclales bacterium]
MIIVALGLLGYAQLMLKSQKFNQTAYYRSQATIAANAILDSVRANKANMGSYACNPCTYTAAPANTHDKDINEFYTAVSDPANFPNGTGKIQNPNNVFTVTITWDSGDGVGSTKFVTEAVIQ